MSEHQSPAGPQRGERQKTDGLFLGADLEISPPPDLSTPNPLPVAQPRAGTPRAGTPRVGTPRTTTPARQIPVMRGSSTRPTIRHENDRGSNDQTRLFTIVAICVAVLGIIGLLMLVGGRPTPVVVRSPEVETAATTTTAPNSTSPSFIPPPPPTPPTLVPAPRSITNNLMPNPSVEELSGDKPANWERVVYNGNAELTVSDQARRGQRSLCIRSQTGGDAGWLVTLTVKPRTSYLFKGWIRTEKLDGGGKGALFNLHPTEIQSDAVTGTSNWKMVQFQFDSGDQSTVHINCLYGGWGQRTGTAWYDDFELIELFSSR